MSKFVFVEKLPECRKGEFSIEKPDFIKEVKEGMRSAGREKLTTANHLRVIASIIGKNYDVNFNAFKDIIAHKFEGRAYASPEDLSSIVLEMLQSQYPKMIDSYVETKLKARPSSARVVYYNGAPDQSGVFIRNGVSQIFQKDVDLELGLKQKKTVAKPAITDAEAKKSPLK